MIAEMLVRSVNTIFVPDVEPAMLVEVQKRNKVFIDLPWLLIQKTSPEYRRAQLDLLGSGSILLVCFLLRGMIYRWCLSLFDGCPTIVLLVDRSSKANKIFAKTFLPFLIPYVIFYLPKILIDFFEALNEFGVNVDLKIVQSCCQSF